MFKDLLLDDLLQEYLLEIKLKNYSIRTLKSVKNNNVLFLRYVGSEFNIKTIDKFSHVHIK